MKQLLRLCFGILSCLLLACDYSPSGSHFEEINPNQQVLADITLTDQQDTIFVRGDLNLYFNVFLPDREYYGHTLELGDQMLSNGDSKGGAYYFQSEKYSDGFHTLRYTAYIRSGTGSLADKYRAEAIQVSRTWVVQIYNSAPTAPAVTHIAPEDGQLHITSEPYTGLLFKSMDLVRQLSDFPPHILASTTDPNTTSWTDDNYIGGPVTYWIVVHLDEKKYSTGTAGTAASYHYPMPAILKASYEVDNQVKITFSSTPFKSFKSYVLSSDMGFFETYDRNDTVVTFPDPGFGRDLPSTLRTYTKASLSYYDNWYASYNTIPGRGTAWGPFEDATILRSAATDRFLIWQAGTLYLYDAAAMRVLQQRDVSYQSMDHGLAKSALSVDGRYAYIVLNDVIHRISPSTLQTLETYQLHDLLPYTDYNSFGIGVSNNHRLMIAAQNTATGMDTVYLVDMERRKVLTRIGKEIGAAYSELSSDGRAMRVSQSIYLEQSNGTWQDQAHVTQDTYAFAFHPTKPLYAYKEGQKITLYSTITGARQKIITTEKELFQYEIDAGSSHLFGYEEKMARDRNLYVYNLDTGQRLRKLKLADGVIAFVYKDRIFSHERFIQL
ncbi:YncE family protein [Pontibacter virosus]|uniref:PKD family protein n=1 Tax=Pontibacter virosus TaxID=1765052 RepID=A0A2U1AV54_9BACT|nr:hypothetical protein [Pontibacter virosus]PVY40231.1 hypothetical protein C8E01_108125 [Pontibacter virosus]